jgi:hypothetical protein
MKEMETLEDQIADTKDSSDYINEMFDGVKQDSDVCPRRKIEIENNIGTIRRDKVAGCDDVYNMGF